MHLTIDITNIPLYKYIYTNMCKNTVSRSVKRNKEDYEATAQAT